MCPHFLKRKSEDVGWEYGVLADPTNMKRRSACFVAMRAQEGFIILSNMWLMLVLLWLVQEKHYRS